MSNKCVAIVATETRPGVTGWLLMSGIGPMNPGLRLMNDFV
jgi:hypothetical protein